MMRLLFGLLLVAYVAFGKFTSTTIVQVQTANLVSSFVTFYNNLLVVGSGGCYIHIYTPQGVSVGGYPLPITCPPPSSQYDFPIFLSLKAGSIITVLLPTKFVSMNLTNGQIVRSTNYPSSSYSIGYSDYLQINNDLILFVGNGKYFVLNTTTLTTSPLTNIPFYAINLPTSFVSNGTTGEAYLCAINPTSGEQWYKKVAISKNITVTNSSVNIPCDYYGVNSFVPDQQLQLNIQGTQDGWNAIYFFSSAGGHLTQLPDSSAVTDSYSMSAPRGFASFATTNYTYSILTVGDDSNAQYLYQLAIQRGTPTKATVKDIVQIPRPYWFVRSSGAATMGVINNDLHAYVVAVSGNGTSKFLIAEFDGN